METNPLEKSHRSKLLQKKKLGNYSQKTYGAKHGGVVEEHAYGPFFEWV